MGGGIGQESGYGRRVDGTIGGGVRGIGGGNYTGCGLGQLVGKGREAGDQKGWPRPLFSRSALSAKVFRTVKARGLN